MTSLLAPLRLLSLGLVNKELRINPPLVGRSDPWLLGHYGRSRRLYRGPVDDANVVGGP